MGLCLRAGANGGGVVIFFFFWRHRYGMKSLLGSVPAAMSARNGPWELHEVLHQAASTKVVDRVNTAVWFLRSL